MARPKKYDETLILTQVMHVFWQQGFEATSMRDIEAATQLSPGSLYNAFGSKQALFDRTLALYIDSIIQERITCYLHQSDSDPLDGIREFFSSTFQKLPTGIEKRSCLLVNTAAELGQSNSVIGKTVKQGLKKVEKALINTLERAQTLNQINVNIDCKAAGQYLGLLLPGFLIAVKNNANTDMLTNSLNFALAQLTFHS